MRSGRRLRRGNPARDALWAFLTGALLGSVPAWAGGGGALPVPCLPGSCGPNGPGQFLQSGNATATQSGGTMTIRQTTNQAALNWSSFNIGTDNKVVFAQPSAASVALNRIYSANPTAIFGDLQANGQIYLINLNGFLFGKTATVNANSLIVSSLPMSNSTFQQGILEPLQSNGDPALGSSVTDTDATYGIYAKDPFVPYGSARTDVLDLNGNPVPGPEGEPQPVQVLIEPGAVISAASQGRLLIAGQSVTNGGELSAPDGQVILAAGSSIFLQASSDPSLRGLVVEVDSGTGAANQVANQVTNLASGSISTPTGNTTLVALAVNQDGLISATTSVSANGSIRLEAADTVQFGGSLQQRTISSSHGGTLTVGPSSDMSILPDLESAATEVDAQPQLPSTVTLLGEQVILQGGSITAPGGDLTATAAANPALGVLTDGNSNARLRIDPGTTIDLAGSQAPLPIAANLVAVQLRANELANDPTQRNGPLRGQTIIVDARDPSPLIANVSSEVAAVPENVAQRTESGGTATFESEGDIVVGANTTINVSGGATTYLGGQMQTSYLIGANGQLYPVATANPLMSYVGVLNPTFTQSYNNWGVQEVVADPGLSSYQSGYVQGAPAGTVQFAAHNIVLNGQLLGNVTNGEYQRSPSTAVSGGQLIIGLPGSLNSTAANPPVDYLAPAVTFVQTPPPVVVADDAPFFGNSPLRLPISYLTTGGFASTEIFSNSDVTLPAGLPLTLLPGSSLSIEASRIDLLSSITAPAGALSFTSTLAVGTDVADSQRAGVFVGDGVTLDVRGNWTNDLLAEDGSGGGAALAPTWQNAGSISLVLTDAPGSQISIGSDAAFEASGGAWLQANGSLTGGRGGAITINAGAAPGALAIGSGVSLDAFGVNGAAGGSFTLNAPRIDIENGSGGSWTTAQSVDDLTQPGGVLALYAPLFSSYGFTSVSLNADGLVVPGAATANVLTVAPGTHIDAVAETLALSPSFAERPTGADLEDFASVTTLEPYLRSPVSIALGTVPSAFGLIVNPVVGETSLGNLEIGAGASIVTAATGSGTGSITLSSENGLLVAGSLSAPGGTVTLHTLAPGSGYDTGFLPDQTEELASTGSINVAGTLVSEPTNTGLALGVVYPGGTIDFLASRGAVQTDPGSTLSMRGASASLDELQPDGTYQLATVASAGGDMTVESGAAISLLGSLDGHAGQGSTGQLAAGSLTVELTRSDTWWSLPSDPNAVASFPAGPLDILVTQTTGQEPLNPDSNLANVGVAQLAAWGIDALTLQAGTSVDLLTSSPIVLGRAASLDAPVVEVAPGINARVSAPYVSIGSSLVTNTRSVAPVATTGTGTLDLSAQLLDVVGNSAVQGAESVTLTSSGDIRLLGTQNANAPFDISGSFSVGDTLTLAAARIYPNTGDVFSVSAGAPGSGGAIEIAQTSPDPGTPLSAAAALTLTADRISSTGTLLVPFGTLTLQAQDSLTLGAGSVTSVSGAGTLIPFGQTQLGGLEWIYATLTDVPVTGVPQRELTLSSANIAVARGATLNVSGGGDLSAYEWVPGTGGTENALAAGVTPGLYAILPSMRNQPAPADTQEQPVGSSLGPDATIYWSGGGGLAAGFYPLLPATYALLPDAFLVQATSGFQSLTGGVLGKLADGTPVVAGYLTYGDTGLHQTAGYSGFSIRSGSYGEDLAQYDVSLASTFFSAAASAAGLPTPTLPADAGQLTFVVGSRLTAAGTVLSSGAAGGLGAQIDVSASNLYVGTSASDAPAGSAFLSDSVVDGWKAGSLVLGGETTADGSIDVTANTVTLGSGASLWAPQVILVAGQTVDVQAGASLASSSATAGGSAPAKLPVATPVELSGSAAPGAALLAVSDLELPVVERDSGSPGDGTVVISGPSGSLAAASVASRGALSIDAPGGVTLSGTLSGEGAAWSLGSSSVAFASSDTSGDALTLGPSILQQLGGAGSVRIASTGSIDFLAPVSLGLPAAAGANPNAISSASQLTLASLTLSAAALNDAADVPVSFGARDIVLEGTSGNAGTATSGSATLQLAAGELDIGSGTLTISGFGSTTAKVFGAVVGQGTGTLTAGGNLSIAAGEVTADAGALTSIASGGVLTVGTVAHAASNLPATLAGDLTLSGETVDISGNVRVPAGLLSLQSTQGISIDNGATLSVAGTPVTVLSQALDAPGGELTIAAGGPLSIASGATLDASGAGSAAAGIMMLSSGGLASIDPGAVLAAHGSGGGSFSLDASSLPASTLTPLAGQLTAGGFTQQIDVRARSGDLLLAAGSELTADTVTLTADTGEVTIAGLISTPSGEHRGSLQIFGGNGVEVESGGTLEAQGTAANGSGGSIEIGTGILTGTTTATPSLVSTNGIVLDAGSVISTQGPTADGTLLLRAPALTAGNDVAVGPINSSLEGVAVTVEPVLVFGAAGFANPTAPTASDWNAVQATIAAYMTPASTTIGARLGSPGGNPLTIEAGAEIVSQGDLTLEGIDLSPAGSNWRFGAGNTPVDLTVLAAGNVTVAGTISDGFTSDSSANGVTQPVLLSGMQGGPSASIRLVAGADLTSANPLAVVTGGAGGLTLAPGAIVRTGTGEIDLVAAGDVTVGAGAGAYTAGTPAIAAGGSSDNPYPNVQPALGTATPWGIQVNPDVSGATFSFPVGGGALVVRAGEDIVGSVLTQASPSNWLLRQGGATYQEQNPDGSTSSAVVPAQYGINLAGFDWNFGTLGGGDLSLDAGRDILNVTAAAAGSLIANPSGASTLVSSGGLSVFAGRDIGTAQLLLANGTGTITAEGALTAILPAPLIHSEVGSALYLQDSSLSVQARLGISIDGIYSPTALGQPIAQGLPSLGGGFYSYGVGSGVSLLTTSGELQIGAASTVAPRELLGPAVSELGTQSVLPGTLEAVALGGDLTVGGTEILFPDPSGQLALIASGNITGTLSFNEPNFLMSDAPLSGVPTAAAPGGRASVLQPFDGLLHSADPTPALVVAGGNVSELDLSIPKQADIAAGGDITDLVYAGQNLHPGDITEISAGQDITYSNDCTVKCFIEVGGPGQLDLVAGRNVDLGFSSGVTTNGNILNPNLPSAAGADLTILAGAASNANYTGVVADLISATNTASDLAALAAVPGSSASDFESSVTAFLTDVVAKSPAYQWNFEYFVRYFLESQRGTDPGPLTFAEARTLYGSLSQTVQGQWLTALQQFMQASQAQQAQLTSYVQGLSGATNLSYAQAVALFDALAPAQQRYFDNQLFFGELSASGLEDNTLAGVGFSRGYAAIDAYFPGSRSFAPDESSNPYDGDINLVFSRIYTLSGGNVSLLAPGGSLNVGLANPPATIGTRDPSTLGIVAEGSGDVSIYSAGNVLVNASRIFTLGGGNILIWSDTGSIDAGRGAKSAVSAPPPAVLINANGTVTLSFAGAATGSGIRTIQTDPTVPLGDVSLIAPVGTVNAGDAGIGAAGNINIAAQHVLGLDNIQFGGTSTGVPSQVSSLGATLGAVSSAASGATQAGTESVSSGEARQAAAPLAESGLNWLEVFLTGFGEENCAPEDAECLKRQKRQ